MDGDTLTVYAHLDPSARPRSWRLRLTSSDGVVDQRLDAGNKVSYPRAVGASDLDGDRSNEWWVRVTDFASHGAPWSSLNVFFARRDGLVALTSDGEPMPINYGGITRLGEGAECRPGRLVLLRAEAQDRLNTRWNTSRRMFEIVGTKARPAGRRGGSLVIDDYNDPALDPYYRVDCNGFIFP